MLIKFFIVNLSKDVAFICDSFKDLKIIKLEEVF